MASEKASYRKVYWYCKGHNNTYHMIHVHPDTDYQNCIFGEETPFGHPCELDLDHCALCRVGTVWYSKSGEQITPLVVILPGSILNFKQESVEHSRLIDARCNIIQGMSIKPATK